jgi:Fe/S biogenesis protein NfuA
MTPLREIFPVDRMTAGGHEARHERAGHSLSWVAMAFTVTEKARRRVLAMRADEPDPETLALWVEVVGARGGEFVYDLYFQGIEHADPGDLVLDEGDLAVVVPAGSLELLEGTTLDVSRDLLNPGMVLDNPNQPPGGAVSPAMGEPLGDLVGTVAEKVEAVLARQINPAIAAHGGRAELAGVDDHGVVSLRLSGGCQGCGMAAQTLRQGIEVALRDAIPEITDVVDVTDHAAGENPYVTA